MIKGDNYKAWDLTVENPDNFWLYPSPEERIEYLVQFGILAPSSHNSQPWKFSLRENEIIIQPDFNRALPYSDINNRQLYISLGCAVKNIEITAQYYGYDTEILIEKYTDIIYLIRLKLTEKSVKNTDDSLVKLIPQRVTNRHKHLMAEDLDLTFINELVKKYQPDLNIFIVKDRNQLLKIADLSVKAGIEAMENKGFRFELSRYVKNSLTRAYTGMPCFGLGIPTPVSFLAPTMLRFFNMNKAGQKADRELLEKHTQSLMIITSQTDDIPNWIKTGQAYQEISLNCLNKGIFTAPQAGIIQIGNYYQELQKVLETTNRAQFFCRLGKTPEKTNHSPRIPAEEVIK